LTRALGGRKVVKKKNTERAPPIRNKLTLGGPQDKEKGKRDYQGNISRKPASLILLIIGWGTPGRESTMRPKTATGSEPSKTGGINLARGKPEKKEERGQREKKKKTLEPVTRKVSRHAQPRW